MKKLFTLAFAIILGQLCQAQDLLKDVSAYESDELTQFSTGYNDFLNKTLVAPEGMKFVVVRGKVNQEVESTLKVDSDDMIFEAATKSYVPIGYVDKGATSFKSPRDLNLKRAKKFAYIYVVDKSVTKGTLKLGTVPPVSVASIGKEAPAVAKPRMMKILSNEVLDKFEAKDDYETQADSKTDLKTIYTPASGKWLKVELNVLAPENPDAKKNNSFNFHPSGFHLAAADGSIYKCAAFIRDGNYDDPFAESMNTNVRFSVTEPKKLTLIFFFSESKGDFKMFFKGVEAGTITVK